ncbi:MAG TPA: RsmE family RNA methyltransferase [Bacteroidota bacterium]|nr:RsmE family RNA methyltransferase [Bacteroidota bacterium]
MEYFYVDQGDINGHTLVLRGEESKHLVRVMRKTIGDRLFVTDGNDAMYEAAVAEIGKDSTVCVIQALHRKFNEPQIEVTLAVSLLKNPARFDFLIEKATELGVRTIMPLRCERTISRHEKYDRWKHLALAAMKQCGRSWLPRIQPLHEYKKLIESSSHWQLKLMPHEKTDAQQTIGPWNKHRDEAHAVLVTIGPEGGFTDEEVHLAAQSGFKQISLGTRRLRTETAALAALAQLL